MRLNSIAAASVTGSYDFGEFVGTVGVGGSGRISTGTTFQITTMITSITPPLIKPATLPATTSKINRTVPVSTAATPISVARTRMLATLTTLEETGGTYVEPTIFDGVTNAMKIAQEEIFGPVLSVITFDSAEEAIAIANDTQYGLAAAVWTADISKAHLTAKALRAGSVWVNQYDGGDMTAPFGGFKQSGNGSDKSLHAFDKHTELKSTWIKL